MLNVHLSTVLVFLELALLFCVPGSAQLTSYPLFTVPSSLIHEKKNSLIRRFAPRLSSFSFNKRRRNSLVNGLLVDSEPQTNLFKNLTRQSTNYNPYLEFYSLTRPLSLRDRTPPQNDFVHTLLPVPIHNLPATIEILNHHYHLNQLKKQFNDLNQLSSNSPKRIDNRLDNQLDNRLDNHQLINSNQLTNHQFINNQNPHIHQSILIHHPVQSSYSPFYSLHSQQPHLIHHKQLQNLHNSQLLNRASLNSNFKSIVNQSPSFSLINKVQQLKQKLKQQKLKLRQAKLLDFQLNQLNKLNTFKKKESFKTTKDQLVTTASPLIKENSLTTTSSSLTRTGYLEIGSTAHLNQFGLETDDSDFQYVDNNNQEEQTLFDQDELNKAHNLTSPNELDNKTLNNKIISNKFNESSTNRTGNVNIISSQQLIPTVTSLIKNDLEHLFRQFKPANLINFNQFSQQNLNQLDLKSKYAYDLIGTNATNQQQFNQNVQVDFKERTAPDISAGLFSRALGSLTSYLPSAIKITRQSGCVGGTKCQFFLSCWLGSGSLGSSCGPMSTCCITPSKQDIQPAFYGPVINDPHCGRSSTRISRIVGGMDASFGQFPWLAFVQVGGSRCGGALVASKYVITAGHCVARSQHSPGDIRVTLGDYILNSDIESLPHEVFTVSEVKLHPNFRFTPQADRYDVAVLILDHSIQYRDNIKPICLPQKDASFLNRVAYVAGWGALSAGSKLRPKVLQHVNVPVIDNNVCEIWHRKRGINIKIHDEMICAGYQAGNKDACQGDSGGPLALQEYGVWYLIGIVSAGYSCAKSYQPGIYHRVSSSSDWISSVIYSQNGN